MSRERRSTVIFGFLIIAFVFVCSAYFADGACVDFPPWPEHPRAVAAETVSLGSFDQAKAAFAKHFNYHGDLNLPAPQSVKVHGRIARIAMDHPVDQGNDVYAQIWQLVYRSFHRWRGRCVIVEFTWPANPVIHQKAGGFTQHWIE